MWLMRLTWGLPNSIAGLLVFIVTLPWCKRIGYKAHTIVVKLNIANTPGYV